MLNQMRFFLRAFVLIGAMFSTVFFCCVWFHNPHELVSTLVLAKMEVIVLGCVCVALLASLTLVLLGESKKQQEPYQQFDIFMLLIAFLALVVFLFVPSIMSP